MAIISVIVPVFKVEKYLNKCVKSILEQTFADIEVILVDDGSPDKCPEICDMWAKRDQRVKVIHKKNGGLSDARNAGLEIAKGKFIAFVDSDDWVDLNLYHTLLSILRTSNSDVACCKIAKVWENENKCLNDEYSGEYRLYDTEAALFELITDGDIQQVVWNKLYRRSILCNIMFEVGKANEDEFWTYQVLGNANQVVVVDYVGYYYLQRNGSIMGSTYSIKRLDAVDAKVYRQEYLSNCFPSLTGVAKKNLLYTCLYHGQLILKYIKTSEKEIAMIRLKKVFKQNKFKHKEWQHMSFKDKFWLRFGYANLEVTCNLRNLFKIGC